MDEGEASARAENTLSPGEVLGFLGFTELKSFLPDKPVKAQLGLAADLLWERGSLGKRDGNVLEPSPCLSVLGV